MNTKSSNSKFNPSVRSTTLKTKPIPNSIPHPIRVFISAKRLWMFTGVTVITTLQQSSAGQLSHSSNFNVPKWSYKGHKHLTGLVKTSIFQWNLSSFKKAVCAALITSRPASTMNASSTQCATGPHIVSS
jgi:hypothetical protein